MYILDILVNFHGGSTLYTKWNFTGGQISRGQKTRFHRCRRRGYARTDGHASRRRPSSARVHFQYVFTARRPIHRDPSPTSHSSAEKTQRRNRRKRVTFCGAAIRNTSKQRVRFTRTTPHVRWPSELTKNVRYDSAQGLFMTFSSRLLELSFN